MTAVVPRSFRAAILAACAAIVVATLAIPSHAQPLIRRIHAGTTSLDGPVGRDGVFPASANTPTTILGEFYFNDPSPNETSCLPEGWTSHDLTAQDDLYFHVDDFAGLGGDYTPIAGTKSLWCGARPATTPPLCLYGCLPGYGNDWDQGWCTINCLAVTGDVTVNMDLVWDTEPNYDYVALEYDECDDNWVEFAGGINVWDSNGSASVSETVATADHSGNVRIRIRVVSDGAFSDEDCLFPSDGAAIVDNLEVTDGGGTVLPLEDFEGEAVGATASDDWNACGPTPPYGDFACLFPAATAVQEVSLAEVNSSCVWGFICASTANYSCGGFPAQAAIPYQDSYGQFLNNEIWSPWMTFAGTASQTTHMSFDVYRDLTLDGLVFYDWRVRTRDTAGGCPSSDNWQTDPFIYYGGPDWYTHEVDLDPFLGPNPAEIQVALGVRDFCQYWCGVFGSGSCHSHSPLFDNVTVYRENTHAWVVDDYSLFQDDFAPGGTAPIDSPAEDYALIRVTEPEFGIGYLIPADPLSGPAVFCHVRNLPGGKSGAVVAGDATAEVPAMSTPDWTVLQMLAASRHRYRVDLNDALYEPGDTVSYYFSARDAGGGVSYYSHLIGRTDSEAAAQANPMEATVLPAGGAQSSGILYVDHYSGHGAEPYFMTAFEALGLEVDRYDRNAPSSMGDNSLGTAAPFTLDLEPYTTIIVSTGTHGTMTDADYAALRTWLDGADDDVGLYLTGDDLADDMASSASVAAGLIRSSYIDYSVTSGDHIAAGEAVSPLVVGNGLYFGADSIVVLGTRPAINDFDVLAANGAAQVEALYSGGGGGAVVSQSSLNPQFATVNVVISGFSYHHIRDDRPGDSLVMDRYRHLHDILAGLGVITQSPTGGGGPAFETALAQNVPNPFNPVTTIVYTLREPAPVRIVIYDVSGARVRTLVDRISAAAGEHRVAWDGANDAGQRVASGVYFYRMRSAGFTQTRKMVMLK